MDITYENLLMGLYIVVAIMLIIALYHVIFIVVDLRKIMRRVQTTTEELQEVIMKPVGIADKAMDWVVHQIEHSKHGKKHDE
jgi:hypothetical protein